MFKSTKKQHLLNDHPSSTVIFLRVFNNFIFQLLMKTQYQNKDFYNDKVDFAYLTQTFLQIFIPVFILALLVFSYIYYAQYEAEKENIAAREKLVVNLQQKQINLEFKFIFSHLKFLSDGPKFKKLFYKKFKNPSLIEELSEEFLHFSATTLIYDQIRFLDEKGLEVIRINFNNGIPTIVPNDSLQDKSNRYYFKDAIALERGDIYASRFDLNIERGEIEKPFKPMIRFATPVFDSNGKKRGIILLNYLAARLLNKFSETGQTSIGEKMLINENGYWLKSPNINNEWGFMQERKKQIKFPSYYPEEWEQIEEKYDGQFETKKGAFSFTTVYPYIKNTTNNSGIFQTLQAQEFSWKIVSHIPPHIIELQHNNVLRSLLPMLFLISSLIVIGSWLLARISLQKRMKDIQLKKLSAAVEQSSVTVVITNTKGEIEYVNPKFCESTGYSLDEVYLQNPRILKSGKMPESIYEELWEVISNGKEWRGELYNKKKNGDLYWEYTRVSPIRDQANNITHFLAVKEDITLRKEMESQLKEAHEKLEQKVEQRTLELSKANHALEISNKDLEDFAHAASHDLQEPLRKISSFTSLLEKKIENILDDEAKQYISFITNASERMRILINELLKYSRLGNKPKKLQELNTNEIVDQVLSNLEIAIRESNAEIIRDPLPKIKADETQLFQLFQNLIGNAIKYRNSRAVKIHIGKKQEKNITILFVKDNGIGIDPKHQEKIFTMFQRLHSRSTYSGSGVGLAICKKIVERHNGKLWVESEKGKGSIFFFSIPAN